MLKNTRFSIWLLFALMLLPILAACGGADVSPPPATTPQSAATSVLARPTPSGAAPYALRLVAALSPAIDAACLQGAAGFDLQAEPFPAGGLEPGQEHVFCAIGAPDGAEVKFTLTGPDSEQRAYEATSFALEGGAGVATLLLSVPPGASAGQWMMSAAYVGGSGETMNTPGLSFDVRQPSGPYIALRDALTANPEFIRAGIGGMEPGGMARFALYRLNEPNIAADATVGFDGIFLISTVVVADEMGRADLELDVADLPEGAYLLLLLPEGVELGDPPTVRLPEQTALVVLADVERTGAIAREDAAPGDQAQEPAEEALPPAPQPAEAAGGLPDGILAGLLAAELPVCVPTATPSLRLWPAYGEIGDWWYGCASGFGANETVLFSVDLANGQREQFTLATDGDGVTPFRWYSAPGEGVGDYRVQAEAPSGNASITWNIAQVTRPHVLVYPHEVQTAVGAVLHLTGFPANAGVELGLYRLNTQGLGAQIKRFEVQTNSFGAYSAPFEQAFGLETGEYALVALGGPTFAFAGIDVAASALEFFSYNTALDPRYEVFTLYLGRTGEVLAVEVEPEPAPAEEPAETPSPEPAPPVAAPGPVPPPTFSIAEDVPAETPTCPSAVFGAPAMCVLPTTLPRGTFVYMLMHDFPPRSSFNITVAPPRGARVPLTVRANEQGLAEAHWYTLNTEPVGNYDVTIRGGGLTLNETFTVVEPTQTHVVVQPRAPAPGTPVIVSVNGFEVNEPLILARYRSTGSSNGMVNFELMDTTRIRTGGIGGGQTTLRTTAGQRGRLFLVVVFRPDQPTPLAMEAYRVGEPLYLSYPFAWGQNYQEGQ